jgi:hypothetical protein
MPSTNLTLRDLPSEIIFGIYQYLPAVSQACLALTSKKFYTVHRTIFPGRIYLYAYERQKCHVCGNDRFYQLHHMLQNDWIPSTVKYDVQARKLVKRFWWFKFLCDMIRQFEKWQDESKCRLWREGHLSLRKVPSPLDLMVLHSSE